MKRPAAAAVAALALAAVAGAATSGTIATVARIAEPRGLAIVHDGGFLVAEPYANRVERVAPDGTVTVIAGTGTAGFAGDGGPAIAAELNFVHGVAVLPDGAILIADTLNDRIRKLAPDGTITTVAGSGVPDFGGDGGPAAQAGLDDPRGVAAFPDGRILIPDTGNDRVRLVGLDGTITTVAGTGHAGFAGDGGPATAADLDLPFSVAPEPDGGFLVTDAGNDRIRRVWPDGHISTVAGDGTDGAGGDGGPAVAAQLTHPHDAVPTPDGGFLIADEGNNRVRRVLPDGTIETVAGTGVAGFSGDGGPALDARLNEPKDLAVLPDGRGFLVSDYANGGVREVLVDLRPPLELTVAAGRALHARVGRSFHFVYTLSVPARVRLELRRGPRLVRALRLSGAEGRDVANVRPLPAGVYRLTLAADTLDGRVASAHLSLVVSR